MKYKDTKTQKVINMIEKQNENFVDNTTFSTGQLCA